MKRCKCGHAEDEHAGPDQGTVCLTVDCSCEGFEEDPEGEPEPDLIVGEEVFR